MMLRSPWYIQIAILLLASSIIGLIHNTDWNLQVYPNNISASVIVVAVISIITHIRSICVDKTVILREVENNTNMLSFYLAYNITDLIWILLFPIIYFAPYYFITLPRTSIGFYYLIGLLTCWWSSGMAYVISATNLSMQWANLIGVFVVVILGAFLQGFNPSIKDTGNSLFFSYNRWAMEALAIKEFGFYNETMPNVIYSVSARYGICQMNDNSTLTTTYDCDKYIKNAIIALSIEGIVFRIIGFCIFYTMNSVVVSRFITTLFMRR